MPSTGRHATCTLLAALAMIFTSTRAHAQLSPENTVRCVQGSLVMIAYGDHTVDCRIDHDTDLDTFEFHGSAGDEIRVVFRGFDAVVELRDPLNNPLPDGGEGINDWVLSETGLYRLRIFDGSFSFTGPYRLQLERTWPLFWGAGLSHGDVSWADTIDPDTDTDRLTFKGRAGTEVRLIVVGQAGDGFGPSIEVLSPDGSLLGGGGCAGGVSPCSFFTDAVLTQDGDHYVQLNDSPYLAAGEYEIDLQCLFGDCPLGYYIRSVHFESSVALSWDPVSDPDATYDVVEGNLHVLRDTSGDFSAAVSNCISSGNLLPFADALEDPDPDQGLFYVVRAVQGDVGPGSYDTGRASQISRYGGRTLGPMSVNDSPDACDDPLPVPVFSPDLPLGDIYMQAGAVEGSFFDIEIRVTNVADLYGTAFHVTFDPDSVAFSSFDSAGSVLLEQGAPTYFNAAALGPGEVAVSATLIGQVAGVPNADGLLITLRFTATATTPANPFAFSSAASRQVTICPTPDGECFEIAQSLAWTGGTLTNQ